MTARHRIRTTHALILRRRDVNDADRILTVFTPGEGKQELLAKGVRKTTSRKAGHLETFTHAALVVAQARTWDIVTEAATVESFRHLRRDLEAIGQANYICEVLDAFSETGDENQPLWDLVILALRELDASVEQGAVVPANLLRWYLLRLLSLTGFQPQLFHCLGCARELEQVPNFFSPTAGGVFCPPCGAQRNDVEPIDVDTLRVLRYLQSRSWPEVDRLTVRLAVARTVDSMLHRYLMTILERHLRSSDFLHRLQTHQRDS